MSSKTKINGFGLTILKGSVYAVIGMLLGVLVFAIFVKLLYMSNGTIKVINQIIKGMAIAIACFLTVREEKGLVKGALIGLCGCVFTALIFSIMGAQSFFSVGLLIDLIMGVIVGAIFGIIAVNIKNKNA